MARRRKGKNEITVFDLREDSGFGEQVEAGFGMLENVGDPGSDPFHPGPEGLPEGFHLLR